MKVLVDKLPADPTECIFNVVKYSRQPYSGDLIKHNECIFGGMCCNCTKLKQTTDAVVKE